MSPLELPSSKNIFTFFYNDEIVRKIISCSISVNYRAALGGLLPMMYLFSLTDEQEIAFRRHYPISLIILDYYNLPEV